MNAKNTTAAARNQPTPRERTFTVEDANRALVFVRPVVQDIVDAHRELMRLRDELRALASSTTVADEIETGRARLEQIIDQLNALQAELREVGCDLKDWANGLVDFPARHEGRRVLLCWKLGEPAVEHWHELEAGFAGRQPLPADFG